MVVGGFTMPTEVKQKFQIAPDTGSLKQTNGEYSNIQNIRGWGGLGSKRRGVQFSAAIGGGVMGMFDLFNDGDPTSPNKILVVGGDGIFYLFDYTEFVTVFDFMFDIGVKLGLQSPDLNWWSIFPDSTTGILSATVISAPINTISSDLFITQNQHYGFRNSTNIWRLKVSSSFGNLQTSSFALTQSTVLYSSIQAFVNGFGPVFQDESLNNWRMTIDNSGILGSLAI